MYILIILGVLYQSTILIIPPGFNSDAAASSLLAYDIISQKKWILFSNAAHTEVTLNFPLSPITPLIFIFLILGFVDWGVRLVILLYNLLSSFFLFKLTDLWFSRKTALISLIFFLFSSWSMDQFNLVVPTAVLFTTMPIYAHQLSLNNKKYLPLAYSLLGLSFYFFSTAKIIISLYLLLYFLFNPKSIFNPSVSLFIITIIPWFFFNLSVDQKEVILRPDFTFTPDRLIYTIVFSIYLFVISITHFYS